MNAKAKIVTTDDQWEDRSIGADEQFVEVAPDITAQVDAALDLHPICIRLQKNLIDNLKALAQLHGLGYQPLVRQILTRWVESEVKQMVIERVASSTSPRPKAETAPRSAAKVEKPRQRQAA